MPGGPASKPGPIAAAITPRNRHEEIDFGAAFELIDFLCRSGVAGIALFTAIGEYASLTAGDRSRLLCLAVKRSRVPIYAGIGAATLDSALGLARRRARCRGRWAVPAAAAWLCIWAGRYPRVLPSVRRARRARAARLPDRFTRIIEHVGSSDRLRIGCNRRLRRASRFR